MFYYVYKITNLINGKVYIGKRQSKSPYDDPYMGSGTQIKRAIHKYGVSAFIKEIIEVFDTADGAALLESKLVTAEFVAKSDNYNMHEGGYGGFAHINHDTQKRHELNEKVSKLNKDRGFGGTSSWSDNSWERVRAKSFGSRLKDGWNPNTWERQPPDKKELIRSKLSASSTGEGNSQFGRIWISSPITKEVCRIRNTDPIPEGWVRGKTGKIKNTVWVNNGNIEHLINIVEYHRYEIEGYSKGRLKSSLPK